MAEVQHTTVLDPRMQVLGAVYAKALVGATEKSGNTEAVLEQFDSLVHDVLDKLPKLDATLGSPRVPFEAKERLLDRVFGGTMAPQLLSFIKVVARRGRWDGLRATNVAARNFVNELRGRVEVFCTTAAALDEPLKQSILEKIRASLGREIELKTRVDERVLGGMVLRVGDTVYDGSLSNQLKGLRNDLVAAASQPLRSDAKRFATAN